ncbi:globin family protein [Aquabacterium sp.]|uniref:globin family protein n=1 Tax=Aquabacterium sp. TaxID=1872578 RepID=UPI003784BF88
MTPDQIRLVQASFARVKPEATAAAEAFYRRLFELDPSVRGLFHGNMAQQGEKLMQMIGAAVGLLGRPETLFPVLHALGARHVGYGVQPGHYDTVGQALMDTLGALLGDAFGAAQREAWAALFAIVKREMLYTESPASLAA